MKRISLILLLTLLPLTGYAHDKVVVIPLFSGSVDKCGTEVGSKAFVLDLDESCSGLRVGEVFSTTGGHLIQITGTTTSYVIYCRDDSFLVAPSILPDPVYGVKGPFYHLYDGGIVYAKYL